MGGRKRERGMSKDDRDALDDALKRFRRNRPEAANPPPDTPSDTDDSNTHARRRVSRRRVSPSSDSGSDDSKGKRKKRPSTDDDSDAVPSLLSADDSDDDDDPLFGLSIPSPIVLDSNNDNNQPSTSTGKRGPGRPRSAKPKEPKGKPGRPPKSATSKTRSRIIWDDVTDKVGRMHVTLESSLMMAVRREEGNLNQEEEIVLECSQIAVVVAKVMFTSNVEVSMDRFDAGERGAIVRLREKATHELSRLLSGLQSYDAPDRLARKRTQNLFLCQQQNCAVLGDLILEQETDQALTKDSRLCFKWQSALRFYLRASTTPGDTSCRGRIADCSVDYDYEYLGSSPPAFAITPCTERIFISITLALRSTMAVSLSKPTTGSAGRTETAKELARSFGKPLFTYTCSQSSAHETIRAPLSGAAQCGGWLVLERYDTMPMHVLAFVAVTLQGIFNAIRADKDLAQVSGTWLNISISCAFFLTGSPHQESVHEYADLALVMRPVACPPPCVSIVANVVMQVHGYKHHAQLSQRVCSLFALARDLLPAQPQHAFGLRAVLSVVRAATRRLQRLPNATDADEMRVLSATVSEVLCALLPPHEAALVLPLARSAFPEVGEAPVAVLRTQSSDRREEEFAEAAQARGLQSSNEFLDKIVALDGALQTHSTVFVVGPVGAGKSEVWRTLAGAGRGGRRVKWKAINPNSMHAWQLCGVRGGEGEWVPGALANVARDFQQAVEKESHVRWIVIDGEAVPDWLGLVATAMDGERVLRLESSESVHLSASTQIIIEATNLRHAAPHTVSRGGHVHVSCSVSGAGPMVASWLKALQRQTLRVEMEALFNAHLPALEAFVKEEGLRFFVPTSSVACCASMLRILDGLLEGEGAPATSSTRYGPASCAMMWAFAAIWGYGGALAVDRIINGRKVFNSWWAETVNMLGGGKVPDLGTVFDYYFDLETGAVKSWAELVSNTKFAGKSVVSDIVVSTPEQVCTTRLLSMHGVNSSALVVGEAGSGKTACVQEALKMLPSTHASVRVAMHHYADAAYLQAKMRQALVKKAGKVIGPPGSRRIVFFVDDVSTPNPDKYGIRSACALLLQRLQYGIWYDPAKLTSNEIVNIQFMAATRPSYGASTIDPRLTRHFTVIGCCPPDDGAFTGIFASVIGSFLQRFEAGTRDIVDPIANASGYALLRIAERFVGQLGPVQYTFSLHEVNQLIKGLSRATPEFYGRPDTFLSLWAYECERVLGDRLETDVDCHVVRGVLRDAMYRHVDSSQGISVQVQSVLQSAFTSEMPSTIHAVDPSVGTLSPMHGVEKLRGQLLDRLATYNTTLPTIDLTLWSQVILNIVRCTRVLTSPHGHLMLCGDPGLGKSSIVRLAAFVSGHQTITPSLTVSYNFDDFCKDLESAFAQAGVTGQEVVFLINDFELVDKRFLVLLHEVMQEGPCWRASKGIGEAHDEYKLFAEEQRLEIVKNFVLKADRRVEEEGGHKIIWEEFVALARQQLHVVLCLQPAALQAIGKMFPSILHKCHVSMVRMWSESAMVNVAEQRLQSVKLKGGDEKRAEKVKYNIVHHAVLAHRFASETLGEFGEERGVQCQPSCSKFPVLLQVFVEIWRERGQRISSQIELMEQAVAKMQEMHEQAELLRVTKEEGDAKIKEQSASVEALLEQVGKKSQELADMEDIVKKGDEALAMAQHTLNAASEDISLALSMAKPTLAVASKALKALDKTDLSRVKAYTSPPPIVEAVLAATMLIASPPGRLVVDVSWSKAKRSMSSIDRFMIELMQTDKEHIPPENLEAAAPYLSQPNFSVDVLTPISPAIASLCDWCLSVVEYNKVYTSFVLPKQVVLRDAQHELSKKQKKREEEMNMVKVLEAEKAQLTVRFGKESAEKNKLQSQQEKAMTMHQRATILTSALEQQGARLMPLVENLKTHRDNLLGDSMLGAVFVTYCGTLDEDRRIELLDKARDDLTQKSITYTQGLTPVNILVQVHHACLWHQGGLPGTCFDAVCSRTVENVAIATANTRCSLFVDPDQVAQKWLKRQRNEEKAVIVHARGGEYISAMKTAISAGELVAIELDGAQIDLVLGSLLSLRMVKKGKTNFLWLGGEFVECYRALGKIYLRTGLDDPKLPAHVRATTSIINFEMQDSGTYDHLLTVISAAIDSDLEEKRSGALQTVLSMVIELNTMNEYVMKLMSSLSGSVIGDDTKVEEVHELSIRIAKETTRMEEGEKTLQEAFHKSEEMAGVIAHNLCEIWRAVKRLHTVNITYGFKFWSVSRLVFKSVRKVVRKQRGDAPATNEEIEVAARRTMETFVVASLAAKDRLPFVILARLLNLVHDGTITAAHIDAFMAPSVGTLAQGARTPQNLPSAMSSIHVSPNLSPAQQRRGSDRSGVSPISTPKWGHTDLNPTESVGIPNLHKTLSTKAMNMPGSTPHLGNRREAWRLISKPDYVSEEAWARIAIISKLFPNLAKLPADMRASTGEFRHWVTLAAPESHTMPVSSAKASPLEVLFVIRTLRPDRLPATVMMAFPDAPGMVPDPSAHYLQEAIKSVGDLKVQLEDGGVPLGLGHHGITPILCVLAANYDPGRDIRSAAVHGMQHAAECDEVSAHGGSELLIAALNKAIETGGWLIVRDLHACVPVRYVLHARFDELCKPLDEPYRNSQVHDKTRVFILTEPSDHVDAGLARLCVKVHDALPLGLRAKQARFLEATASILGSPPKHEHPQQTQTNSLVNSSVQHVCLLTCLLHAMVVHRSAFGRRGWGEGVFCQLRDLVFARKEVSFVYRERASAGMKRLPEEEACFYLGQIIYGGLAEGERDQQLIVALTQKLFANKLVHDPLTGHELPAPTGEDAVHLYPLDSESMGDFMYDLHNIVGLLPKQQSWSSRLEVLREALEDLNECIPQESVPCENLEIVVGEAVRRSWQDSETKLIQEDSGMMAFWLCVLEESRYLNRLLAIVVQTLQDVEASMLRGSSFRGSNPDIEKLAYDLLDAKVPEPWSAFYPSTLPLGLWVNNLVQRFAQLQEWAERPPERVPLVWLAGLCRPHAFLSAIRIYIAHKENAPVHDVQVCLTVTEYADASWVPSNEEDVLVHGIHIQGAKWFEDVAKFELVPSTAKSPNALPVMRVIRMQGFEEGRSHADEEVVPVNLETDKLKLKKHVIHEGGDEEEEEASSHAEPEHAGAQPGAAPGARRQLQTGASDGGEAWASAGSKKPVDVHSSLWKGTVGCGMELPLYQTLNGGETFVGNVCLDPTLKGPRSMSWLLSGAALVLDNYVPGKDLEPVASGSREQNLSTQALGKSFLKPRRFGLRVPGAVIRMAMMHPLAEDK